MKTSRRTFLQASAALPFAARSLAMHAASRPVAAATRWVLFGTGTNGIYRAPWNPATGDLGPIELAVETDHPTFLAQHPILPLLLAANESPTGDGSVSSFHLDAGRAELKPLQKVSAKAPGTTFVSIDHTGNAAFAANYGGGSLAAFGIDEKGTLTEASSFFDCRGNASCGSLGPVKPNQDAPHLHCATVVPDNKYLLVCNLGEDAIEVFPISPRSKDPLGTPSRVETRPGSGPRHITFHPNKRWAYVANELNCTLELWDWEVKHGQASLSVRDDSIAQLLPAGTPLTGNSACEVEVSPDGHFVYANCRGANTLTVFAVDKSTGLLTQLQQFDTGGKLTRHFAFDPTRHWLLCANQGSSTITVFAHDPLSGHVNPKHKTFPLDTPMYVHFL